MTTDLTDLVEDTAARLREFRAFRQRAGRYLPDRSVETMASNIVARASVAREDAAALERAVRVELDPPADGPREPGSPGTGLIGALDLVEEDQEQPYLVSQVARGDKDTQKRFAAQIGGGLNHLQLNHNANSPGDNERSQRARSIIFLAYGVLLATALGSYHDGDEVPLYVPENGFIAINPPLTRGRLGSLSTRTAHPVFLGLFQRLLDNAGLRVRVENPFQYRTKGEMLTGCAAQPFLKRHAYTSTSCARYARSGFRHCGRCVPCLVRRGAFHAWGQPDKSTYVYNDISRDDKDHARFDDVRSAAMAVAQVRTDGLDRWLTSSLNTTQMGDTRPYRDVARRGIEELGAFLDAQGVL